ncbi:hypothetical protein [Candidatus Protofrankia californiensis]|uniref:hypothetical protein n=1 Tax=Candidatus Protofrankia californiensis TaxID=1839754 RepID=UPI0019D01C1D|nr:hypothetical protein [Candidatus Protofrankia californiensis]
MSAPTSPLGTFAAAYTAATGGDVNPTRGQQDVKCPAHDDGTASLSVGTGKDGRVLLVCQAGCSTDDVLTAVGLDVVDLFPPREQTARPQIVASYRYVDEQGTLLFTVHRFEPKTFRQQAADGAWRMKGVRRVLYRLPEVLAAIADGRPVYVVEGEKDADRLASLGHVATTCPQGAGKWRPEYTVSLAGASEVHVIGDNDDPGRTHARQVAKALEATVGTVKVWLPASGKDVSDHLNAGHGLDDLVPLADDDQADDVEPSPVADTTGKPDIEITGEAAAIRDLRAAIERNDLPDLYVTSGEIVHLERVSGDIGTPLGLTSDPPPLPYAPTVLTPPGLASTLARYAHVYQQRVKVKKGKNGEPDEREYFEEEVVPPARVLAAVLSGRYWPGVRPLHGIVGSPVLRPDGSLLQTAGYDPGTGLYFAPKVDIPWIPARPDAREVAAARQFLLGPFLGNFPWESAADRANYVGLLVTNILRPYVRTVTPFGMITATTQASGKTILSEGIGLLYGQRTLPWPDAEAEMRKAITAALGEQASVLVFDNLREGTAVEAPVLAQLLTAPTWSDRRLGTNTTVTMANDRLWLATGNNLRIGGDMATRTVVVRLDPKMPRPELRTGFTIPDLDQWVKDPANQRTLLRHLLVLVVDWIAQGAPRAELVMRQFTPWARAVGGFLAHHDIPGFLANAEDVRAMDDEDNEWEVFLTRWVELFEHRKVTSATVRKSADIDMVGGQVIDRWEGRFLSDDTGKPVNAMSLGRRLGGQVGRFHGEHVLRRGKDPHTKQTFWWVTTGQDDDQ